MRRRRYYFTKELAGTSHPDETERSKIMRYMSRKSVGRSQIVEVGDIIATLIAFLPLRELRAANISGPGILVSIART